MNSERWKRYNDPKVAILTILLAMMYKHIQMGEWQWFHCVSALTMKHLRIFTRKYTINSIDIILCLVISFWANFGMEKCVARLYCMNRFPFFSLCSRGSMFGRLLLGNDTQILSQSVNCLRIVEMIYTLDVSISFSNTEEKKKGYSLMNHPFNRIKLTKMRE